MKASLWFGCLAGVLALSGSTLAQDASSTPAPAASATQGQRAQVDLNTAEIPALEAVPEIGTDLANAVVAGRPYKSVDDAIRGLKLTPEKTASLRAKVFVSPPPTPASAPSDTQTTTRKANTATPSAPPPIRGEEATSRQEVTERYDRAQQGKAAAPKK